MGWIRLPSTITAQFIFSLIFISICTSGINSYCATGPSSEKGHNTCKLAVEFAHDELNDYYKEGGPKHLKDTNGETAAETIMTFQKYQPQHFIIICHGYNGRQITVGDDPGGLLKAATVADDEYGIQVGQPTNNFYWAGAPFSTVILLACDSGITEETNNFKKSFFTNLWCWNFIGFDEPGEILRSARFLLRYSDLVTDDKKTYYRGWELAAKRTWFLPRMTFFWWVGGPLDHPTASDKYRHIGRNEAHEWTPLYSDSSKIMSWNRAYPHNTNGAYIVFHGVVNNDDADLDAEAELEILIRYQYNQEWITYKKKIYTLQNTECWYDGKGDYGGSDICTYFINPATLDLIGSNQICISLSIVGGTADCIYIDRFEYIEIGNIH